jgi:hypothetical protein
MFVNHLGDIGGYIYFGSATYATMWSDAGSVIWEDKDLSFIQAMNGSGYAVGWDDSSAVLWAPDGTKTSLANPRGGTSAALGINRSGQSVGYSGEVGAGVDAVKWASDGTATVLRDPGVSAQADAINGKGAAVGWFVNSSGKDEAVLWGANGGVTNLQTILGAGWSNTSAADINGAGDICGSGLFNGVWEPFLLMWSPTGFQDGLPGHYINESPIQHASHALAAPHALV